MKQSNRVELLKDSWYRCYEQGVNKKLKEFKKYVSKNQLKKRKRNNSDLIQVFMEQLKVLKKKISF